MRIMIREEDFNKFQRELHTEEVAGKLKSMTVAIAGLGGLGSNAAVSLARAGIGKLTLIDFDKVELSNLNRQAYFLEQVGMNKTDALIDHIKKINPYVTLEAKCIRITAENCMDLFGEASVVIEAVDEAHTKAMIIETILSESKDLTVIAGSGMAGYGDNSTIHEKRFERLRIIGDGMTEALPGIPLMAPRVAVVSNMQANAALEIILGENS